MRTEESTRNAALCASCWRWLSWNCFRICITMSERAGATLASAWFGGGTCAGSFTFGEEIKQRIKDRQAKAPCVC